MTYTAAVIGCGKIGALNADDPLINGVYAHAEAYVLNPKVELIALCDTNVSLLEQATHRWQVQHGYQSVLELLRYAQPEIVSVCTPDHTHAALLTELLLADCVKAIWLEKPLALTLAEATALVALAKLHPKPVVLNYSRRYCLAHQALKAQIAAGSLGRILAVNGYYTKGLFHNGTHWLDLAMWFFGKIANFSSQVAWANHSTDPCLDVHLQFEQGATGYLKNITAAHYTLFEMDIIGEQGRIQLVDSGHRIQSFQVAPSQHYSGYQTLAAQLPVTRGLENMFEHALTDLLNALEHGGQPHCGLHEGYQLIALAERIVQAAQAHSPLAVAHYDMS